MNNNSNVNYYGDSIEWRECPSSKLAFSVNLRPLLDALSTEKAVAFVGAGPSIDAGYPSWESLMSLGLEYAKSSAGTTKGSWDVAERYLNQKDFLMVAELLQSGLGSLLERFLWEQFSIDLEPSSIHHALARMPFSIFLTTNYDRLLEKAFREQSTPFTWQETDAFLNSIKYRRRVIVKTHGDVGCPSTLVLTRSSYRDRIHSSRLFNDCLKALLSFRTFLFVGTSLRDPDLLHLFDEIRLSLNDEFGPHFAIFFSDEIDTLQVEYYRKAYCIESIVIKPENAIAFRPGERSSAVTKLLHEMMGRASLRILAGSSLPSEHTPLFNLPESCGAVLQKAVELTGSLRGDIYLLLNEHLRSISRIAMYPKDKLSYIRRATTDSTEQYIPHDTLVGTVFLRKMTREPPTVVHANTRTSARPLELGRSCTYIDDVSMYVEGARADIIKRRQIDFRNSHYREVYSDVKSELLCPIYCDDQIVGVLNVESELVDAYTPFHGETLERLADHVGGMFREFRTRSKASAKTVSIFKEPGLFKRLMNKTRLLKQIALDYILWEPDVQRGVLWANTQALRTSEENSEWVVACQTFLMRLQPKNPTVVLQLIPLITSLYYRDVFSLSEANELLRKNVFQSFPRTEENVRLIEELLDKYMKPVVLRDRFSFSMSSLSLASRVLRNRERITILDAETELGRSESVLASAGCKEFAIHGPVMAFPMQVDGETAGALVAWSKLENAGNGIKRILDLEETNVANVAERIYRVAHLIFNDPDSKVGSQFPTNAEKFLELIESCIDNLPFEGAKEGSLLPVSMLRDDQHFRDKCAVALIKCLADGCCGLPRIRLWIRDGLKRDAGYKIWHSYTSAEYTKSGKSQLDAYVGSDFTVRQDDPYVRYSISRFKLDPYARHQHRSMFNSEDENWPKLDKTPNCPWIVGLVARHKLWGFVSADDHQVGSQDLFMRDGLDEPPRKAFQRRCVDLVTHLLWPVVFHEVRCTRREEKDVNN